MIHKHKLERLTEDETGLLLYCLNDGLSGEKEKVSHETLPWIRPQFAFNKLNEYAGKVSSDKKTTLQSILDKIVNP